MTHQVYILCAKGEEHLAHVLSPQLADAGYDPVHSDTVPVGDSPVAQAQLALNSGIPIILCATARAMGTEWTYRLVNAANGKGTARVFIVKMESDALLSHLDLGERIADYAADPVTAVHQLISAIQLRYPVKPVALPSDANPYQSSSTNLLAQPLHWVDLDPQAIDQFRELIREENAELASPLMTQTHFLDRLLLLSGGRPTRAAALLFGSNPQLSVPAAVVQCVEYSGTDKSADQDARKILGNARAQVDDAFAFIRARVARRERPSVETLQANVTYRYPMVCLREVLVNAVVHREYADVARKIHVRIFSDRIEISSPGEWLGALLDERDRPLAELSGESVSRNPTLANALSLVRYYEGEGSGLPKAVRDSVSAGAPEPTVRFASGMVVVTVRPSAFNPEVVDRILTAARARSSHAVLGVTGSFRTSRSSYVDPRVTRPHPIRRHPDKSLLPEDDLLGNSAARTLLVGQPGSGKSSYLTSLAGRIAETAMYVPIFITLRQVDPKTWESLNSFLTWMDSLWEFEYGITCEPGMARALLLSHPTCFLLDGYDEILVPTVRQDFMQVVDAITKEFRLAHVVIATRDIGVDTAGFTQDWMVSHILPWSREDFIRLAAIHGGMLGMSSTEIDDLASAVLESDPAIAQLAQNPLLATLIVELYSGRRMLPNSRGELVGGMIELMGSSWDARRGINVSPNRSAADTWRSIAADLALAAFLRDDSPVSWQQISQGWAVQVVREGTARGYISESSPAELLDAFVSRGNIVVSTHVDASGAPVFAFRHRLFAEWFTAEGLVRAADDEAHLAQTLLTAARRGGGKAVVEFAIFFWRRTRGDTGGHLIITLLNLALASGPGPISANLLDAMCDSLDAKWPSAEVREEAVRLIISPPHAFSLQDEPLRHLFSVLELSSEG